MFELIYPLLASSLLIPGFALAVIQGYRKKSCVWILAASTLLVYFPNFIDLLAHRYFGAQGDAKGHMVFTLDGSLFALYGVVVWSLFTTPAYLVGRCLRVYGLKGKSGQ
jgi:hypothetical protein